MMLFGISCHDYPPLMMGFACAIGVFIFAKWARSEDVVLPQWHWGDARRRPELDDDHMLDHVIGATFSALAGAYAFQNPMCG